MAWDYWGNTEKCNALRNAKQALYREPKIGPDDGCWHCAWNRGNAVCELSGYSIIHQTGPACNRFVAKCDTSKEED